jgi:hypothetical protein
MTRKAIGEYLKSKGLNVEYEITECDNGLRAKIYASDSARMAAGQALYLAGVDVLVD